MSFCYMIKNKKSSVIIFLKFDVCHMNCEIKIKSIKMKFIKIKHIIIKNKTIKIKLKI